MSEGEFEAAWLAGFVGLTGQGQGGGFDDTEVARRVLDASEAGARATGAGSAGRRGPVPKPSSEVIISVSLDDLDGDLLS